MHFFKFREMDNLEEINSHQTAYINRFFKNKKRSYNARFNEIYTKSNAMKTKQTKLKSTTRCKNKYTGQIVAASRL